MDNFVVDQRVGESLEVRRKGIEVPIDPRNATCTSPSDNGDAIQFEADFSLGKEHQTAAELALGRSELAEALDDLSAPPNLSKLYRIVISSKKRGKT